MKRIKLNKKSTVIFKKLIEDLTWENSSRKIDTTENTFLPVHVELIGAAGSWNLYSIAHYGQQNGDAMRDPDVTFYHYKKENIEAVIPSTFRNDYIGKFDEVAIIDENDKIKTAPKALNNLISFCNIWLTNIKNQQPDYFKPPRAKAQKEKKATQATQQETAENTETNVNTFDGNLFDMSEIFNLAA